MTSALYFCLCCNFALCIVGDVIGSLCAVIGSSVFRDLRDTVLVGLRKNLEVPRHQCNTSGSSSELPEVSVTITNVTTGM